AVSRRHWAAVKIGLVIAFTVAVATLYGLGLSWWLQPWASTGDGRIGNGMFDVQGVAPIGYTLFAVALGIFAGTVWRKMLPAMAAALVGFLGLRIVFTTPLATASPDTSGESVLPTLELPLEAVRDQFPHRASGGYVFQRSVRGEVSDQHDALSSPPGR